MTQSRPTANENLNEQSLFDWAEDNQTQHQVADESQPNLGELRPTLVRASAGSGKTYQLTARLLRILLQGAPPETILATTFTKKAAGEILNRLLTSLAAAANPEDDKALNELRQQVGLPSLPRSACLSLLDTLLRNIHRLRICTLDALFAQAARSFPFELNLPPAWRLSDEIEEAWLQERAIDKVIGTLDRHEITSLLSMLGKGEVKRSVTRELISVVQTAYAIDRQSAPKAWSRLSVPKLPTSKEITRASGSMLTATPKQPSLQAKLQSIGSSLESRDFSAVSKDRLVTNIAKARQGNEPVKFGRSVFPEGLDDAFDVLYAIARSETLRLLRAQNEATGNVLQIYDQVIGSIKQLARVLSFDDVAIRLAKQFAGLDERSLASRMDGAIDHLLLDEFQDTSPVQWQVLRPMALSCSSPRKDTENATDSDPIPRSFFCVGDTKQAIYGWRGGVAAIFDTVAQELPDVEEVSQNCSYRSSSVIMEAVNAIFPRIARHPIASPNGPLNDGNAAKHEARAIIEFARNFPAHVTARKDLPGHARFLTSRKIEGNAAEIRAACFEDAAGLTMTLNEAAPEYSIGILTRTNRGVAEMILLLEQLGVDVSQEGGNPLTDSAAVEVILSALMMAEHPGDGRWPFHLSSTPLAQIDGFGPDYVRNQVEEFGLTEAIEMLATTLAPHCDPRDTIRLKQLTRLAIQYQANAQPRLSNFVRLVREKRVERPQAAAVRVMTVHQSKGLEFDAVVLPQIDGELVRTSTKPVAMSKSKNDAPDGLTRYLSREHWHFLPQSWQRAFGEATSAAMTEALCLMYVAMTRARQSLHMIMPPAKRRDFTTKTPASLIYHALQCSEDPSEGETVLWEIGDPDWYQNQTGGH